jgi:RNA polymerase sigma-70 factor (ECF subfamily)
MVLEQEREGSVIRAGPADAGAPLARLLESRQRFLDYLRQRIDDPELAEDILQDSLLRAVRAAPELRDAERLVPWFYRVLRHAAVDAYRRRGVARRDQAGPGALDEARLAAEPSSGQASAVCECFRPLVATLKPEYGQLIEALDLRGESPDAVAARLGITANNLKVRRHRARQALRRRLEETCRVCARHHCLDCTCAAGPDATG